MASISNPSTRDIVAKWDIPLTDGVYTVEFEHGTASGLRGIFINGKCLRRTDFKFLLIGEENFKVGTANCTIQIKAVSAMEYGYFLLINGLPIEEFLANQAKQLKCWVLAIGGRSVRIVLQLDTMEVHANGRRLETTGEFTDNGSETHFILNGTPCYVRVTSSGRKRSGLTHALFVGDLEVPEAAVDQLQTWDAHWDS